MEAQTMLSAYWRRIGMEPPRRCDVDALRRIHRHHLDAIVYENVDIQLGSPIRLDVQSLWQKLVVARRGGFCYEVNGLLAWVLRRTGFTVHICEAAPFRAERGPRQWGRHIVLLVNIDGREWIADVGLGDGFREPLPLQEGVWQQNGFVHRMESRGDVWRCYPDRHGTVSSFDFATQPRRLGDFGSQSETLSTAPDSSFVRALTLQRPRPDALLRLRARTLSFSGPAIGGGSTSQVTTRGEFTAAIKELFGLVSLKDATIATLWTKASVQHEAWLKQQEADH